MPHNQTQAEWETALADRAMAQLRSTLYLELRYLNAALGALPPQAQEGVNNFATDGAHLYYTPGWLLPLYRKNRSYLLRAYLHSLLHCIFRHLWLRTGRDAALWGLACDISVEAVLDSLTAPALSRPVGWLRQQTYADFTRQCGVLAAGPLYRLLLTQTPEQLNRLQQEFYTDSHRYWPGDDDQNKPETQMQGRKWEQMGRQTQLSMEQEQAGRQASDAAGAQALQAQLQAARSRRSYKDFLRRFAVWREEAQVSDDEFDLGYYSYGLRTYGNMPLIEPLESREAKKIRDFVIVLDTSESTNGTLLQNFLKETFALLRAQDSFFRACRILVLQADDKIQEETWLTDLDALDRYTAQFTLTGGGGTDFRPAFARIDALRTDGVLRNLQGVLYFTDGKGIYPSRRPPYEVAFLFVENAGQTADAPPVPPWAMQLVLQPEEFMPTPPAPPTGWDAAPDLTELPEL